MSIYRITYHCLSSQPHTSTPMFQREWVDGGLGRKNMQKAMKSEPIAILFRHQTWDLTGNERHKSMAQVSQRRIAGGMLVESMGGSSQQRLDVISGGGSRHWGIDVSALSKLVRVAEKLDPIQPRKVISRSLQTSATWLIMTWVITTPEFQSGMIFVMTGSTGTYMRSHVENWDALENKMWS